MSGKGPEYIGKELEAMSFAANYHGWIVDEISPHLGETVAEIGAGIGSVSKMLLTKSIKKLYAFEPSSNMYPFLLEELSNDKRAQAVNGYLKAENSPVAFDSIVYINVLEHIEDDGAELKNSLELLKSGGKLLLFVPALEWLYSEFDRNVGHHRRYTKRRLKTLVEESGFRIVRLRYFDFVGILPWFVNFVLLENTMNKTGVTLFDNYVVPVVRRLESIANPPVGKNLLLVAQK